MTVKITKRYHNVKVTKIYKNCIVDYQPTWLLLHFNNEDDIAYKTIAFPMNDIIQVVVDYDNVGKKN